MLFFPVHKQNSHSHVLGQLSQPLFPGTQGAGNGCDVYKDLECIQGLLGISSGLRVVVSKMHRLSKGGCGCGL